MVAPTRIAARLPVALLIALAVSVAVGGALAGTDQPKGGLDDGTVDVPVARLGDQGAYAVTLTGDWDVDFGDVPQAPWREPWLALNFSWTDGGQGVDADGSTGPVDRLEVSGRSWDLDIFTDTWSLVEEGGRYDHHSGAARPFLRTTLGESVEPPELRGNEIPQEVLDAGLPLPQSNAGASTFYRTDRYLAARPNCFFGGPFQGKALDLDGHSWSQREFGVDWTGLYMGCGLESLGHSWYDTTPAWWNNAISFDDRSFKPLGREVIHGHEAAGFTLRDPDGWLGGIGLDVWFSEDLAYPLRFVTYPHYFEDNLTLDPSTFATYELVSYLPGSVDRVDRGAWSGAWGTWTLTPLPAWGMDEAGIEHPFPASQAYAIAKQDANVSAFLDEVPAAYTGSLSYSEIAGNRQWSFWLTDGPHVLKVDVQQNQRDQPQLDLSNPLAPVRMPGQDYIVTSERDDAHEPDFFTDFPLPQDAPKQGPSVAQVADRWRATGGTGELNAWGMTIVHHWGPDFEDLWLPVFGAGSSSAELEGNGACLQPDTCVPSVETGWTIHHDVLSTETDGRLVTHKVYDRDWDGRYGLTAPAADPADAPKAGAAVGGTPFWQPTPTQAAGAGAIGLLAGALYLLWPVLKAGPLALFSRIEGPQLLDHPVRLRLSQLVAANPGIHFKELRRQSGLANGVLVHHLDKLTKSGLVSAKDAGRYRCYFPPNTGVVNGLAIAAVKADGAQKVLAALRGGSGLGVQALAASTGLGRSTVQYHLQKLAEAGLVRSVGDGHAGSWVSVAA